MKLKFALSIVLLGISIIAWAEDSTRKNWDLSLAYYGETIVHPGLRFGLDYTVAKGDYSAFIVGAGLGGFYHRMNVVALLLDVQAGYRLTLPFGLFFDIFAGPGYMHLFPDGPAYQLADDGSVVPYLSPGYPELMVSAYLGIGWNFKRDTETLFNLYLRLGGFLEYPVNYAAFFHPAVQLSVSFPVFKEYTR